MRVEEGRTAPDRRHKQSSCHHARIAQDQDSYVRSVRAGGRCGWPWIELHLGAAVRQILCLTCFACSTQLPVCLWQLCMGRLRRTVYYDSIYGAVNTTCICLLLITEDNNLLYQTRLEPVHQHTNGTAQARLLSTVNQGASLTAITYTKKLQFTSERPCKQTRPGSIICLEHIAWHHKPLILGTTSQP